MTSETTEPAGETPQPEPVDEMVRYRIESAVENALANFCDQLDTLINRGDASEDDIARVLVGSPDFSDAWQNWLAESEEANREDQEL